MIMARNEDGTYSQVGFVKDNGGIDTEYIYDKDGDIVFEKGFTRETSGTVPLTINGIGKDLKAWSITGNTVQNGAPTPENPVDVQGVGDYDSETGLYRIPVVTRGKNLFDYKTMYGIKGKYLSVNGEVLNSLFWAVTDYIPCSGNVFTINPIGGQISAICLYDSQKNYITGLSYDTGGAKYKKPVTIRSKINASYIRFSYYINSDEDADDLSKIQIEIGDTATPYEPYHEPITTPIYLPTPLYSGEALRSDGSREVKWRKLVLTGTESVIKNNNSSSNYLYFIQIKTNKKIKGYCSHLTTLRNPPIDEIGFNTTAPNFQVIYFNFGADIMNSQSSGNTVAGFKEYLAAQYAAGTPVTVWYQLAEPTTETFTAPQIPTINGTTVIDVDTAVKPTEMYTKYKSSK